MEYDAMFWVAMGALIVGGIALVSGVICAAAIEEKGWWMWALIIIGTILSLIGTGLLIYHFSYNPGDECKPKPKCYRKVPQSSTTVKKLPIPAYQQYYPEQPQPQPAVPMTQTTYYTQQPLTSSLQSKEIYNNPLSQGYNSLRPPQIIR